MRRTRRLFLLAIVLVLAGVGSSWYAQKGWLVRSSPPPPKSLPDNVQASSQDWCHYMGEGDKPKAEICAGDMERVEEPAPMVRLRRVELKLYHKGGEVYDRVRSASAEFDEAAGTLFSDGEVEITLAVPAGGEVHGRLLSIRSSGVKFDASTGKAVTDRPARFSFDLGEGQAVGAEYDPATRELNLLSEVDLLWRGRPGQKPMKVEAGRLLYRENEAKVYLSPWSRLSREQLVMEAGHAVVTLEEGSIRLVEATKANGTDRHQGKELAFGADELRMELNQASVIETITGSGRARLESAGGGARTVITTDRVELQFEARDGESLLRRALANGRSMVDSSPGGQRGGRRLSSEVIEMKMDAAGRQIEAMQTHSPAVLDLLPGRPGQDPRRRMTANRLWLTYGEKNQLKSARAVEVTTRTQKPPRKDKKLPPPAITSSKDLLAEFDLETGDLRKLEQWQAFQYEGGTQKAKADRAVLDSTRQLITLEGAARAWDSDGSVAAAKIVLHEETGDFTAESNVRSTRVPDAKNGAGGMLSGNETLQATAARMSSMNRNQRILYEGGAVLWQGASRLQADRVLIDRENSGLLAEGKVISQFPDQEKPAPAASPDLPETGNGLESHRKEAKARNFTTVRANRLDYRDRDRVADYRGQVLLTREAMDIRAHQLRAWLKENAKEGESKLERAVADGEVRIFQSRDGRTRRSTSEHAEYYVEDGKVVLTGGHPQLVDSLKGITRGRQLTYWANNDKFQVDGADTQPGVSILRRK